MRLAYLFILMAVMQLSVWAVAGMAGIHNGSTAFYILEGLCVANIILLAYFYRSIMRPINTLARGMDLLKGQDRTTRLLHVGQPEVDRIADTFNMLLDSLKDQRVQYEERTRFINLLIESAPIGVVILDYDGRVTMANPACDKIFDSPEMMRRVLAVPERGHTADYVTDAGATLRCSCHTFIDCGIEHRFYLVEDISNSIAAAERAAYEKVIRIISHEVNNTVAGLRAAFDASIPALGDPAAADDIAEVMRSCSERTDGLARFIGRFAEVVKIPSPRKAPVPLDEFVRRSHPFLQSLGAGHGISIDIDTSRECPEADIDAPLIEQVLVNIVKNSIESIESRPQVAPAGMIRIRVGMDSQRPLLEITDNGAGISPDKAGRLFTPFYTDKPLGQGIGLTFVRDVLRRHEASYTLATDPADGLTRFTIRF